MNIKITIIIIGFIAGIIFCMTYKSKDLYEGFSKIENENCPNLLLREGHDVYGLVRFSNGRQTDILDVVPTELFEM